MSNRNAEYLRISLALKDLYEIKEFLEGGDIGWVSPDLAIEFLEERRQKVQPSSNSKAESPF